MGLGKNNKMIIAATAANMASTVYSFFKKVFAPFAISFDIFSIVSFCDGRFFTHTKNRADRPNAANATSMLHSKAICSAVIISSYIDIFYLKLRRIMPL
ncbi:unknown [Acidaminococcus sp. CAG:917]|nr:unknown [Acidaminococcus sp. CAG:917]